MNDLQTLIILIVETPGIPLQIGAMIATAMLIGFILYDNTPNMFFRVTVVFTAFFVFVEWIRASITNVLAPVGHPGSLVTTVSILLGVLFIIGLFVGMGFAHRYRAKMLKVESAADDVIEKIRNGNFGTSRINIRLTRQETKPLAQASPSKNQEQSSGQENE